MSKFKFNTLKSISDFTPELAKVGVCGGVCVCVCVRERERERENIFIIYVSVIRINTKISEFANCSTAETAQC